jgi:ABC-type uncharacterized transport system ATPase subunit
MTVSVMRRGEMVATRTTADTSVEELAELMVGRSVLCASTRGPIARRPVLSVENLTVRDSRGVDMVKDVSFDVRAGEIVGIAGVAGNGQSELLQAISGIRRAVSGKVMLHGETDPCHRHRRSAELRHRGMGHVPEDRQRMGLVSSSMRARTPFSAITTTRNISMACFSTSPRSARMPPTRSRNTISARPIPMLKTANFSGGNQQKIVLAREMERDPEVLVIGQPTRGVDVGAIEFIHKRIIEMRDAGQGRAAGLGRTRRDPILSDRVLVMFDGRIVGERGARCQRRRARPADGRC